MPTGTIARAAPPTPTLPHKGATRGGGSSWGGEAPASQVFSFVIPAKAGIHLCRKRGEGMDPRFRGNDDKKNVSYAITLPHKEGGDSAESRSEYRP